jgi:hypothetical protein
MIIKGMFEKGPGSLSGRPYSIDFDMDVVYVQVLSSDAVYSDYRQLPDTASFKDHYVIIDFDKAERVVGFTVEGLIEDYKAKSLRHRLGVDLGIVAMHHLVQQAVDFLVEYLNDVLPSVDQKGFLIGASDPAFA